MVTMQQIEAQLDKIGCNFKVWGRAEIRELTNILMPEEQIAQIVNGSYEGGFALLCVTNYRVLLVDRKPMQLTIEDIRYDMMGEVDYNNRLFGATVRIFTPMHNLSFSSWSSVGLRKCVNYVQQRVLELRQQSLPVQQPQAPVSGVPPLAGYGQGWNDQSTPYAKPYVNPYTKTPLLMKRRRFPSFY